MGTSIINWTVRVTMMVLAGLVSLSILGAVATMTTDTGGRGVIPQTGPQVQPAPQPAREEQTAPVQPPEAGNMMASPAARGEGAGTAAAVAAPEAQDRTAPWLEAIAYALLALAGLAAIAILLLWRVLAELRRIADAR